MVLLRFYSHFAENSEIREEWWSLKVFTRVASLLTRVASCPEATTDATLINPLRSTDTRVESLLVRVASAYSGNKSEMETEAQWRKGRPEWLYYGFLATEKRIADYSTFWGRKRQEFRVWTWRLAWRRSREAEKTKVSSRIFFVLRVLSWTIFLLFVLSAFWLCLSRFLSF